MFLDKQIRPLCNDKISNVLLHAKLLVVNIIYFFEGGVASLLIDFDLRL